MKHEELTRHSERTHRSQQGDREGSVSQFFWITQTQELLKLKREKSDYKKCRFREIKYSQGYIVDLKPANKIEASSHLWSDCAHPVPSTSETTYEPNQFLHIRVPCIYIHHS